MPRPKVLLLSPLLHPDGNAMLANETEVVIASSHDEDTLAVEAVGAHAVVSHHPARITGRVMDAAGPQLRVLSSFGSGVDSIDVEAATHRGILVVNSRGVAPGPVAEHAVGLMIDLSKRITRADRFIRANGFGALGDRRGGPLAEFRGRELAGKTVGLIGYGAIGREVARRCHAFDMALLVYDPYLPTSATLEPGAARVDKIDDLLAESDFVSLHAPLTDETHHLIDARALGLMRPEAFLVNCSRGALIDEQALVEALSSGRLGGAGLDVFEREPPLAPNPLHAFPNVVMTPHNAGFTEESAWRLATSVAENVVAVLQGATPRNVVNPEVLSPT